MVADKWLGGNVGKTVRSAAPFDKLIKPQGRDDLRHSFLMAMAAAALACASAVQAAGPDTTDAAAAYCVSSGGTVINRLPTYGTNGSSSTWLYLNSPRQFCQFTSPVDGSRIHILVGTLYTTTPTLAALAYYAEVKPVGGGGGNPASYYCTQLGGTDLFGGVSGAGGGWVGEGSEDTILEACIFPDMSSIDSWGLDYHSAGIIRGIDLTTVMRYTPPPPAAVH
jgi:putative hemolysin